MTTETLFEQLRREINGHVANFGDSAKKEVVISTLPRFKKALDEAAALIVQSRKDGLRQALTLIENHNLKAAARRLECELENSRAVVVGQAKLAHDLSQQLDAVLTWSRFDEMRDTIARQDEIIATYQAAYDDECEVAA